MAANWPTEPLPEIERSWPANTKNATTPTATKASAPEPIASDSTEAARRRRESRSVACSPTPPSDTAALMIRAYSPVPAARRAVSAGQLDEHAAVRGHTEPRLLEAERLQVGQPVALEVAVDIVLDQPDPGHPVEPAE